MKRILLIAFILLLCNTIFCQYNNDTANDAVIVTSKTCYVYKTPQVIPNTDAENTLTRLPIGLPIMTNGFKDNYFKIRLDGEDGYIFCLSVTTPKRIKQIQNKIQLPNLVNQVHEKIKIEADDRGKLDEIQNELILQFTIWCLFNNQ